MAIEAGSKMPWYKYVGLDGEVIGMDTFGTSGPAEELFTYYGFTVGNVVEAVMSVCGRLS